MKNADGIDIKFWWEEAAKNGYFERIHMYDGDFEIPDLIQLIPLTKESKILELGPGGGRDTRNFAKISNHVVALDVSGTAIKNLKARLPEVDAREYDGVKIPFPDNEFDLVYACFVFQHNPKKKMKEMLLEIQRVLKPGGRTLLEFLGDFNVVGDDEDYIEPGQTCPKVMCSTGFSFDQLKRFIDNLGLKWRHIYVRNQGRYHKNCVNFWVDFTK